MVEDNIKAIWAALDKLDKRLKKLESAVNELKISTGTLGQEVY